MIEAQQVVIARTDEMRSSARTLEDASARIRARSRPSLPTGALDGTELDAAIEIALERVSSMLIDTAVSMGLVATAVARSADNYDDGDRVFASVLAPGS